MRAVRRTVLAGTALLAALGSAPARPGTRDDDLDVVRRALDSAHEGPVETTPASQAEPGAGGGAHEPSPAADEELDVVRRAVRAAPAPGRPQRTERTEARRGAPSGRSWLRVQLSERGTSGGELTLRLPLPSPERPEPARRDGRGRAARIHVLLNLLRAADDDLVRIENATGSLRVKIE